jgi:hypothetical protein
MNCPDLISGAVRDCLNPIVGGNKPNLILMTLDVWDRAIKTIDGTIDNLITDIVLTQTGDVAYEFEGHRKSMIPSYVYVPSDNQSGFDHLVSFMVYDISQEQKNNLLALAQNNVVGIVTNANATGNGNSVFEVFGVSLGLEMQTMTRENGSSDTGGAIQIELKTSDLFGKEPKQPQSLLKTDFDTTTALIEGLLVAVV